jgi:hypothetical protein
MCKYDARSFFPKVPKATNFEITSAKYMSKYMCLHDFIFCMCLRSTLSFSHSPKTRVLGLRGPKVKARKLKPKEKEKRLSSFPKSHSASMKRGVLLLHFFKSEIVPLLSKVAPPLRKLQVLNPCVFHRIFSVPLIANCWPAYISI